MESSSPVKLWHILLGALGVILLFILVGYNGLVSARERVEEAWAQVETQYQRRADVIPNLVSTVKGAASFEKETFQNITEARSRWQGAGDRDERIAAAQDLDTALGRLLVTVENYPALRATEAFRDLMAQLEGTENRISVSRRDYNQSVRAYNVRVKQFPWLIVARMFGFGEEPFFEAAEGTEKAPDVQFKES